MLLRSERAARALGRSVRFSHAARASSVGTEHVLLGVLDVEGTAGQVLLWLGADVERLVVDAQGAGAVGEHDEHHEHDEHDEAVEPVAATLPPLSASPARCARRCSTMPSTTGCSSPPASAVSREVVAYRAGSAAGSSASARAERLTAQR